jgi:hypothetical protein
MRDTWAGKFSSRDFPVYLLYHFQIIQELRIHYDDTAAIISLHTGVTLYIFEEELSNSISLTFYMSYTRWDFMFSTSWLIHRRTSSHISLLFIFISSAPLKAISVVHHFAVILAQSCSSRSSVRPLQAWWSVPCKTHDADTVLNGQRTPELIAAEL